jgi:hypothetical protein
LHAKIDTLAGQQVTGTAAYDGYGDVTGLLLALYEKAREESGLIRDPDADAYYLEDGAAQELPQAMVAAGQYGDLIAIALTHPASQQANDVSGLIAGREALTSSANDLANDVQLAVDATTSRTLSSDLLNRLDRFRRGIDAIAPSTALRNGRATVADSTQVMNGRKEVQIAAGDLSTTLLHAVDNRIATRIDSLNGSRRLALAALLSVIVLVAGSVLVAVVRWRRATAGGGGPATPAAVPDERPIERVTGYLGPRLRDEPLPVQPAGARVPGNAWDPPPVPASVPTSVPTGVAEEPTWRERFGAAR